MFQRFTTIQNIGHNWRIVDGIRVEYFPGFTILELVHEVQKFMNKMGERQHSKDELSSCRCSMTSYGEIKTMKRNVLPLPHLFHYLQKDSQQDVGHSSDLDQRRSGTLLMKTNHKIPRTSITDKVVFYFLRKTRRRVGQSRWTDDDQIQRKWTPSFPSHESIVSRNAWKQRRWKFFYSHLCRWWHDWNCYSHNYFSVNQLSIYRAVSNLYEEYSSCQTRTGRWDPCWQDNLPIVRASKIIDNDTQTFDWDSCTMKFIAEITRNEWKGFHNKIDW